VIAEGVNEKGVLNSQPDSGWLTMTSCNQPIAKKQPTGFWLTKPMLTIQCPKQTALQ